jgi:hypothetical protein
MVMQIGIDSFAAAISDAATGLTLSPVERMHHLIEEIELAEKVGLDVFGIGEHHRAELLDSALVLATVIHTVVELQRKSALGQPKCSVSDSSNALIPFQAICTPIQTRKNDDNCVITVIPVAPRIRANRSANP